VRQKVSRAADFIDLRIIAGDAIQAPAKSTAI
jgi:hypothetical protein